MVTRSPLSASVSSNASGTGDRRTGDTGSNTSNSVPSTKRAACTWPRRCAAARSGRAGVTWGSKRGSKLIGLSVALGQERIKRARRLAFAAFGSRGLGRRGPGIDVEMQPWRCRADEAVEEQRTDDRAGEAAGGDV